MPNAKCAARPQVTTRRKRFHQVGRKAAIEDGYLWLGRTQLETEMHGGSMLGQRQVWSLWAATLFALFHPVFAACAPFGSDFHAPAKLHQAAAGNDLAAIQRWIASGKSLDTQYNDPGNSHEGPGISGKTALMFAAERGNLEAVRLLVDGGANIYLQTSRPKREGYDYTAFDYAVEGGNPEIVKYLWAISDKRLFRKRTQINLLIAYDRFCSTQARQAAARDVVVFLLEDLADGKLASNSLWRISDRGYCLEAVRFLLDRGVAPAPSALVTASRLGLTELLTLYIHRGADVNALGSSSYTYVGANVTPLIAAAGKAQLKTVTLLLSSGADPNIPDSEGRTALIAAVTEGGCISVNPRCEERLEVMNALLAYGALTELRDRFGKSAADYADRYVSDPYNGKKRAILNRSN